jgi:predicted lipoprotein with Yx(FWY)xxD motif
MRSRPVRLLVALASLLLIAAACGGGDDEEGTVESETTAPPDSGATDPYGDAEGATDTTTAISAGGETVELVDSDLGQILASDGRTLYTFMPDGGGPPTCYDDCATTWPPLLASGDVSVGEALDGALFATAPRDDGGEQVTVDGWPLYFFANDAGPGDHNGQGLGGVWFVVGPDGAPIGT